MLRSLLLLGWILQHASIVVLYMPTNEIDYGCYLKAVKRGLLVALGVNRDTRARTYPPTHIHTLQTRTILRNQACTGLWPECSYLV